MRFLIGGRCRKRVTASVSESSKRHFTWHADQLGVAKYEGSGKFSARRGIGSVMQRSFLLALTNDETRSPNRVC